MGLTLARSGLIVATIALLTACRTGPTAAQLNDDNPVRPNDPAPFGMEEFFSTPPRKVRVAGASVADAAEQPVPERVRLGRWLFYDERLSSDRTLSCATCHRPDYAFSQPEALPIGIGGQRGRRRTPSIINLGARTVLPTDDDLGPVFFWDGRATSLEAQVLTPIADPKEMGFAHPAMIDRLSNVTGYRPYFREAFGSDAITMERVAAALADYVRTRKSGNAPYDRWAYGRDGRAMSAQAQQGSEIFFFTGRCAVCHAGFNFSDGKFHNLGVGWNPLTQGFADEGRAAVSHAPRDRGAFKTPGLRDVEKHPPYMHDGSLATLREVVEFYNRGGTPNPGQTRRIVPLRLTREDVDALVAFLQALNGEGYQDHAPRYFPR